MSDDALSKSTMAYPGENRTIGYSIQGSAVLLFVVSVLVGWGFWMNWFSKTDSLVCSICLALGFGIAFARGIMMEPLHKRVFAPSVFLGIAFLVLFYSVVSGRPKLSCIAAGFSVAGWLAYILRSESVFQALSLGVAFMVPSIVDACEQRGAFEFIENRALGLTSGLAEANSQFHIQREGTIEFGHGVADRFSSVGRWDSILPFVGISFFCIYVFRRNLIPSVLIIVSAFLIWMAIRSTAWVGFSWYAERNEVWPDWGLGTEMFLFAIGAIMIVCLDQFFGAIFEPIPNEFVNEDFPLAATVWNWLVCLPSINLKIPHRAFDGDEDE